MSVVTNTSIFFNISKAFPPPSSSLQFARSKVSRVCFASDSRHCQAPQANDDWRKRVKEAERKTSNVAEKAKEGMSRATDRTDDFNGKLAKEKSQEMKDKKASDSMETAKDDKADSIAGQAGDKANEAKEKAKHKAYDFKVKETVAVTLCIACCTPFVVYVV